MTLAAFLLLAPLAFEGRWHATVLNPAGEPVAFELQLARDGAQWRGELVNGADRQRSTSGSLDGSLLKLRFDDWDAVLEARLSGTGLEGSFTRTYRKTTLVRKLAASRKPLLAPKAKPAINVSGDWIVNIDNEVWRASLRQNGARIEGALIPVSGDSGSLTGFVDGRSIYLSRFDGIRATLVKAALNGDVLEGTYNTERKLTGRRVSAATAAPPDAHTYTRMRDASEPFRFSFPDLDGRPVSSTDERFRGKAILITITGSWCPNCHDEAPLLADLYARYRSQGLEIVALGFEYTGEAERDIRQLRLFARKHSLTYPILYAGSTEDAEKKLAQLENFGAYPTMLFIGRDGRVRAIHAGFDGPATGERHTKLKREIEERVQALLR